MSNQEFPYVFSEVPLWSRQSDFSVEAVTVTEVTVFRIPFPSSVFRKRL